MSQFSADRSTAHALVARKAANQIPAGRPNRRRDRVFYLVAATVIAGIVFAGFARTFYLRPLFNPRPLDFLLLVHGIVFTCWPALFLVQTGLVAARRTDIHRRLGIAGGGLAVLMVGMGSIVAIRAASLGHGDPRMSPLEFLAVPLADVLVFAVLVTAGFMYRRKTEIHKRLMLLATIGILPPATSRLPFAFVHHSGPVVYFALADVVLLGCSAYDMATRGRLHRAYVWSGLIIVVSQPLRFVVSKTGAWLAFAHLLVR